MDIKPVEAKVVIIKDDPKELEELLNKRWAIVVMQEHGEGSIAILGKDK